jgi:anaerobic selenocysteine-containing dehydrogenase
MNVLSLEYTDRGAVADRVYGNENFILQYDLENAEFGLLLGTNPFETQGMTLLQRRPSIQQDLLKLAKRGCLVVVDPRMTRTAKIANQHLAIKPGTDLYLLLGMLRHIIVEKLYDSEFCNKYTVGFESIVSIINNIELDTCIASTDIPLATIHKLAEEFAKSDGAFITTRVGVQTSRNSTLTEWAVVILNAITGNIDRLGGLFFNHGAIDIPRLVKKFSHRMNKAHSALGNYPPIFAGLPASEFAENVLSEREDRIRALVVVAGNPVISFPNTKKMEQALKKLELLVCIDIYRSDTGAFAHYNLPAATEYEKGGIHFMTSNFEAKPYVEWRPKLVKPRGQAKPEWDIYIALSRSAGVPFLNDPLADKASKIMEWFKITFSSDFLYRMVLPSKTSFSKLRNSDYGIHTGNIEWGKFLNHTLETESRKIELAPKDLVEGVQKAVSDHDFTSADYPFILISGARRLESFNSWTHNIPALAKILKGNWATINVKDAQKMKIQNGDSVVIRTPIGEILIPVLVTEKIKNGVVAVHQHWGHEYDSGTKTSKQYPGVNVNRLHDDQELDSYCGMPVYNARACQVEKHITENDE